MISRVPAQPLDDGLPEPWASEWGEDPGGHFIGFTVGEVEHRMRWIAPGRFLMGSPESEAGRFDDERQHKVELTRGFWLGETPVTQALWAAVMGENPSRFVSPDRPVEQVSWEDCQIFLPRLGEAVPGLAPRLPSEAEWEYACRAGTGAATWAGDLVIRGDHDAPILDAIAWYGGNSGHEFDLSAGLDSSSWPKKQYPHVKAGTRPVRGKHPNPLGLFDMLGNVYEWCEDWYGSDDRADSPVVDPTGPRPGSDRVFRGGSWYSIARYVRAADRDWDSPGNRFSTLGLRLARGQAQEPALVRSVARAEPRPGGERSRRR